MPNRQWLTKMAQLEDVCESVSVGRRNPRIDCCTLCGHEMLELRAVIDMTMCWCSECGTLHTESNRGFISDHPKKAIGLSDHPRKQAHDIQDAGTVAGAMQNGSETDKADA